MTLALLLLVVGSCQQQQTLEVVKPVPAELSVDAAKQYYEATKHRSKAANKYQFLWDLAKKMDVGGTPIVTVPVQNIGGGNTIIKSQNGRVESATSEIVSVFFYLDKNGALTASFTAKQLVSNANPGVSQQEIYFFDWVKNNLQSIWTIDNGGLLRVDEAMDVDAAKAGRTSACVLQILQLVCDGTSKLGGGDGINPVPTDMPWAEPGCHWEIVGELPCGPGGTNPGGGDPVDVPGLPSPFTPPLSPSGVPIHVGGDPVPAGSLPTISEDAINRIRTALAINSWQSQGVHVTDEERDWFFSHPGSVWPVDWFVKQNLGAATERLAFGILGNFIMHILPSNFQKRMFERYRSGTGETYHMTDFEFNDALSKGRHDSGISDAFFDGQSVFQQRWTWYGDILNYGFALGRGTVYFRKSDSSPIGYEEPYDFNAMPWGNRPDVAEVATRIGGLFERDGARPFIIRYP